MWMFDLNCFFCFLLGVLLKTTGFTVGKYSTVFFHIFSQGSPFEPSRKFAVKQCLGRDQL